jgi:plasmid stability protein
MGVDMTIRDIPDSVAAEIRRRAAEHHRSPENEARGILTAGVAKPGPLTIQDLLAEVQAIGLHTPSDSAAIVREARDARGRG